MLATFTPEDTPLERIRKLNQLAGLELILREWPTAGKRNLTKYSLEGIISTGTLTRCDFMRWTETFALGFQTRAARKQKQ